MLYSLSVVMWHTDLLIREAAKEESGKCTPIRLVEPKAANDLCNIKLPQAVLIIEDALDVACEIQISGDAEALKSWCCPQLSNQV
jgi:hypothetical protein